MVMVILLRKVHAVLPVNAGSQAMQSDLVKV